MSRSDNRVDSNRLIGSHNCIRSMDNVNFTVSWDLGQQGVGVTQQNLRRNTGYVFPGFGIHLIDEGAQDVSCCRVIPAGGAAAAPILLESVSPMALLSVKPSAKALLMSASVLWKVATGTTVGALPGVGENCTWKDEADPGAAIPGSVKTSSALVSCTNGTTSRVSSRSPGWCKFPVLVGRYLLSASSAQRPQLRRHRYGLQGGKS
jgi:hypothetical protein